MTAADHPSPADAARERELAASPPTPRCAGAAAESARPHVAAHPSPEILFRKINDLGVQGGNVTTCDHLWQRVGPGYGALDYRCTRCGATGL